MSGVAFVMAWGDDWLSQATLLSAALFSLPAPRLITLHDLFPCLSQRRLRSSRAVRTGIKVSFALKGVVASAVCM